MTAQGETNFMTGETSVRVKHNYTFHELVSHQKLMPHKRSDKHVNYLEILFEVCNFSLSFSFQTENIFTSHQRKERPSNTMNNLSLSVALI
jgi:hypothetical protein